MALDPSHRYPKEQLLFILGVTFSTLVWIALVVSIVGILYGLLGLAVTIVAHALFLANVRGNAVRISQRQFPDLYARCREAAKHLGLAETPEVYVMQAGGALNAYATKFFSRKFVIIYSDLVDECQDPRQVDFVIGHEMGHFAAGHLRWNAFLWPFMLVPWFGAAYLRAREYTSDRCGHSVVGDVESSMRGLIVLAAGGKHAAQADIRAFMDQRRESGQFWSAVLELVSSHPYLCKRVAALQELHQPGSVLPVGATRSPIPAPVLGFAARTAGGAASLLVVAMVASWLRSRSSLLRLVANESVAIGELCTFISAQAAYASANQNLFDSRRMPDRARRRPRSGPSLRRRGSLRLPGSYTFAVSRGDVQARVGSPRCHLRARTATRS
jgi:Zn-dependent protease with chaperone function